MAPFHLKDAKGRPIKEWTDWTRPKRDYHWKPGRSALELARAWFRASAPSELMSVLRSLPALVDLEFQEGCPEFVTALPERGEGRNHDLWLKGRASCGDVTVCIESKADEPFGNRISDEIAQARARSARTALPKRVRKLMDVLSVDADVDPESPPWSALRYQLLTGMAGTVIQAGADGSHTAVFVIHEFHGATKPKKLKTNADDLTRFLRVLSPASAPFHSSSVWGPMLPRSPGVNTALHVAKVATEL